MYKVRGSGGKSVKNRWSVIQNPECSVKKLPQISVVEIPADFTCPNLRNVKMLGRTCERPKAHSEAARRRGAQQS
eukprot:6193050-Pleurochrysis_carterae.AAC.1